MSEKPGARVLQLFARAKALRAPWESTFQECYDYSMPAKEPMFGQAEAQQRTTKIFDETAVVGVQEFASRIQAGIMPPFARWADLTAGSDVADDQKQDVDAQLDKVTEYVFQVINDSNLASEAPEALLDAAVSVGCIEVAEGDALDPVRFSAVPMAKLYIDVGPDDRVDSFFVTECLRVSQIKVKYPKARFGEELARLEAEAAKNPVDDKPRELVKATRRIYLPSSVETWRCELVDVGTAEIIHSEQYSGVGSCPYVAFRWAKLAGETWGRGPLLNVMPAVKTCNLTVQLILENAEMAIAGMYTVEDDGHVNVDTIQIVPGTIIPHATGSEGLRAVTAAGNFDVGQLILGDMRANIKRGLYNEQMGNPHQGKTPLSATEITNRQADLAKQIGASFGRLQVELVTPLLRRVVHLLQKLQRITVPAVNGTDVAIRAASPLSRGQNYQDVSAYQQAVQTVTALHGPQMTNMIFDAEKAGPWIAKKFSVPDELLRTPGSQSQLKQVIGEMAAQPQMPSEEPLAA